MAIQPCCCLWACIEAEHHGMEHRVEEETKKQGEMGAARWPTVLSEGTLPMT